MTFKEFMGKSGYSAIYIAECMLYKSESRIVRKIAPALGYVPSEDEKKAMRYLIAGNAEHSKVLFE